MTKIKETLTEEDFKKRRAKAKEWAIFMMKIIPGVVIFSFLYAFYINHLPIKYCLIGSLSALVISYLLAVLLYFKGTVEWNK